MQPVSNIGKGEDLNLDEEPSWEIGASCVLISRPTSFWVDMLEFGFDGWRTWF